MLMFWFWGPNLFCLSVICLKNFCKTCKGEQLVKGKKTVKLDIMAGKKDSTLPMYAYV